MLQTIDFVTGDIVRVHQRIKEGEKSRIQVFEGVVLQIKGRGENKTFTVHKTVGNVTVERIWPILSPNIEKVEVKGKFLKKRVRHARLKHIANYKN